MADDKLHAQGEDFLPLRDLLPLAVPLAMSIDTSEVCNFRCRFCVYNQSREGNFVERPAGAKPFMEMAVFQKLVRDLQAFPKPVKKISVHCRGEPMINPNIAEMVALMHKAGVAEIIKISTNGSLLTREKARALLKAGIGQVVFSVEHVTPEGYREITGGAWDNYDAIVENFRILREERDKIGCRVELCAKVLDYLSNDEQGKFKDDFGPYADTLLITGLYGASRQDVLDSTMGRGQSEGFYKSGLKKDRIVCPEPFFFMTVDAHGNVMPCWVDWSNGQVIGNIMETSLLDIWNGAPMRSCRLMQLEGRRMESQVCEHCHFIYGVHEQSDLDNDIPRLLKLYRA